MPVWNELELEAVAILETLEKAGFAAFFVGGYVRDKVLALPVKDIDIATSAKPEEVTRLFAKTVPTGLKHGTVTVLAAGRSYEVTTFRKESAYEDYRRPAEVEFISDLEEDLRRRDFTMNAMAMDRNGRLIDPFGGRSDLKAGVLRCVGRAEERFAEDALRMMRCVRFASTYKLNVEEDTWAALLANRGLLRHVAMERVRAELERMLAGPDPLRGLRLLSESGLMACTKSASELPWNGWNRRGVPAVLAALPQLEQPLLRWALLFRSMGIDPEAVEEAMTAYTFSVKDTEAVSRYVALDRWLEERCETAAGESLWKAAAVRYGREAAERWLAVAERLPPRERCGIDPQQAGVWLREVPAFHVKELAASGRDIISATGQPAGPWVSRVQQQLLHAAALGQVANDKESLLALARELERKARSE